MAEEEANLNPEVENLENKLAETSLAESSIVSNHEPYQIATLRGPQIINDIGRECTSLYHVFGTDATRRKNLHLIDDDRIVYATANAVVFENVVLGVKDYLLGIDEGGVGCVAVHPSR